MFIVYPVVSCLCELWCSGHCVVLVSHHITTCQNPEDHTLNHHLENLKPHSSYLYIYPSFGLLYIDTIFSCHGFNCEQILTVEFVKLEPLTPTASISLVELYHGPKLCDYLVIVNKP